MEQKERLTNRWLVLALLIVIYGLNGADRQIMSVLAEPIRLDLGLSDSQLGLLSGAIFALFYTVFGLPIAWLADRTNRVRVIAAACFFWSLCTAISGMAASFFHLAAARVGVAVGEAGCAPPAYSLISDYFPPERRASMLGLFSLGFPLGVAIGTAVCGWVAAHYGWRMAFFVLTAPGILLSVIMLVVVRHPQRGRLDEPEVSRTAPPLLIICKDFFRRPILLTTTIAGCFSSFATYGMMVWMPAFLVREKGMTMMDIAESYSVVTGGAMMLGMCMSGFVVDRLTRLTAAAPALVPGIAYLLSTPLLLAAIWTPSWQLALAYLVLPFALMVMWLPPALATLQNACPAASRAVTASIFLSVTTLLGNSGGPFFIGIVSDTVAASQAENSLRFALSCFVPFFLFAGVAQLFVARAILKAFKNVKNDKSQAL